MRGIKSAAWKIWVSCEQERAFKASTSPLSTTMPVTATTDTDMLDVANPQPDGSSAGSDLTFYDTADDPIMYVPISDLFHTGPFGSDMTGYGIDGASVGTQGTNVWWPKTSAQLLQQYQSFLPAIDRYRSSRYQSDHESHSPSTTTSTVSAESVTASASPLSITDSNHIRQSLHLESSNTSSKQSNKRRFETIISSDGIHLFRCDPAEAGFSTYTHPCSACKQMPTKDVDGHTYMWAMPGGERPGTRKVECQGCFSSRAEEAERAFSAAWLASQGGTSLR